MYVVSTTPLVNMLRDKYKINVYLHDKYPHDPVGKDNYQMKEYLENLYENMNILFNDNLPIDSKLSNY